MKPEHELRILNIVPAEVEKKIIAAGGKKKKPRLLQQRYTYNTEPVNRNKWMRLRTNGETTTLTIKEVLGKGVSDTKEIEVEVSDFITTAQLIKELGVKAKSYQENYRTLYELNGAEIMIDEWPGIPPYVEIEASNPQLVVTVIQALDFSPKDATGLDVSSIFEQIYNIDVDTLPELKFP